MHIHQDIAATAAGTPKQAQILILADDFTGACEVSLPWHLLGYDTVIALDHGTERSTQVHVVDTDTRGDAAQDAAATIASALAFHAGSTLVIKKIDSLWRGNIESELLALSSAGYRLVVAGALPHLNRSIHAGAPLVDGTSLAMSGTWDLESRTPPAHVSEMLPGLSIAVVPAPNDRAKGWEQGLDAALESTQALILDCATESDLARIAAVCLARVERADSDAAPIALVGTGAFNAALAAAHAAIRPAAEPSVAPHPATDPEDAPRPVLAVVGSASGRSGEQLSHARESGIQVAVDAHELAQGMEAGVPVVLAASATPGDPRTVLSGLRAEARTALSSYPRTDLFLTGGETARAILDDLSLSTLVPLRQLEPGVVFCQAPDGRLVGSKPGTFGSADVLIHALSTLRTLRKTAPQEPVSMNKTLQDSRPFIAVTMGDGAGVGPEVTVGALVDPRAYATCRPVVIGDTYRMRLGAKALGATVDIVEINDIAEAIFIPGRINVIDPHLLSKDLEWGKESAEAGNAAYHYIRIACELGMKGDVQGICTAPLNKAALHSAGHIYPGHTELLAHFMGIDEVSMMLSTPKVKVIHVTTHIGLIDAIARIEPGLVERTVLRGHDALVRAGNPAPKIGVCAINPHAGENGLFGYGEEAEKIIPALEKLQAAGINAVGPLPADTAFFLAGRGDYDLIVAMYHDQGHGPVKVLGIEAGVNITVGLPVIRTSVDHGTAFDIAGTGVVEVGSMIEALAQAVNLAAVPVG